MPFPDWLAYGFAVMMIAVSVVCVLRVALATPLRRRVHRDVNVAHVLMGVAMTGMLVPRWRLASAGAWQVVFAGVAVYFLFTSVCFVARRGVAGVDDDQVHHLSHHAIHMVMACAMLYMLWLSGAAQHGLGSMSMVGAPGGAGDPSLSLGLVVVLMASAIWQLDAMGRVATAGRVLPATTIGGAFATTAHASRPWLAPRLESCCHVAMCLAMGYMLVLMV